MSRSPTTAAGAPQDEDRISLLPDCLLATILSLLPAKDAARTTALSRSWRHLWPSSPLLLYDAHLSYAGRADTVSRVLAAHRGPALRFALLVTRPSTPQLHSWFPTLSLKHLQELVLRPPAEPLPLPPSFLACRSLRFADITNCRLPDPDAGSGSSVSFPSLAELTLRYVHVSKHALHELVSGCTALASLSLDRIFGARELHVRSRSLRSLTVSLTLVRHEEKDEDELQELVVMDAPSLERLLTHDVNWGPSMEVIHAPTLEMLGYLGIGIPSLQLGSTLFKAMRAISLTTEIRSIKTVALEMVDPQVKPVVDFLRCLPCLETLYITSHKIVPRSLENLEYDDTGSCIECLNHHLKKVVLRGYEGRKRELKLAKFLVANARVLQVLKILCANDCNRKWLRNQRRSLCLDNKASLGAQFVFKTDNLSYVRFSKHASNVSLADPFDV